MATASDFVPRRHLLFPLVVDPERRLGRIYGIQEDRWLARTLGSPAVLLGAARAWRHGHGPFDGPERQLPADFVVGMDGRLAWARYARSLAAAPDVDGLMACARSVRFPGGAGAR
jgi:hypothetical protein